MYEDARNVGLVESNPFANLRLLVTDRRAAITAPTMDDYRALLEATTVLGGYGAEMKMMITFAAWSGVRQGELFGLQWDDVDEDEIMIRRSRKLDGSLGLPKNGQDARCRCCHLPGYSTTCLGALTRSCFTHPGSR